MSHFHTEPPHIPSPRDVEPVFREPTDIHPKVVAGGIGGLVGLIVSWAAFQYLGVQLDDATTAIVAAAIVNLFAAVPAYLRSSKRRQTTVE